MTIALASLTSHAAGLQSQGHRNVLGHPPHLPHLSSLVANTNVSPRALSACSCRRPRTGRVLPQPRGARPAHHTPQSLQVSERARVPTGFPGTSLDRALLSQGGCAGIPPGQLSGSSRGFRVLAAKWTRQGSGPASPPSSTVLPLSDLATSSAQAGVLAAAWQPPGKEAVRRLTEMASWQEALAYLRQLQGIGEGWAPRAIHYNVVLKKMGDRGACDVMWDLLREMEGMPLGSPACPDNYTYSTGISACTRRGEYHLAMRWVEAMAANPGCIPDEVAYTSIIHALSCSGQPAQALRVFHRMCEAGWEVDSTTYGAVLTLYTRSKKFSEADQFYRNLLESGARLKEGVFNCMLMSYRDRGQSKKALALLEDMRAHRVTPSQFTHSLIMHTMFKRGDQAGMLQYLRRVKIVDGYVDASLYHVLLGFYRQKGRLAEAASLLQEMESAKVAPTEETFRHMLAVLSELGDGEGVARAQAQLESLGVPMDIQAYSNMVQGFARAGRFDTLKSVVGEMRERGIEADSQLQCIFLSVLTRSVLQHGVPRGDPPLVAGTGVGGGASEQGLGAGEGTGSPSAFHDLVWCLEQLNAVPLWDVVSTVECSAAAGTAGPGFSALVLHFLEALQLRSQKVAASSLMDLLWALGRLEDGLAVWRAAATLEVVPVISAELARRYATADRGQARAGSSRATSSSSLIAHLDVRSLSRGAAHMAMYEWLTVLASLEGQGIALPRELTICVGSGHFKRSLSRADEGDLEPTLKEAVTGTLQRLRAPFAIDPADSRQLLASREELMPFLASDWQSHFLLASPASGSRTPSASVVASPSASAPSSALGSAPVKVGWEGVPGTPLQHAALVPRFPGTSLLNSDLASSATAALDEDSRRSEARNSVNEQGQPRTGGAAGAGSEDNATAGVADGHEMSDEAAVMWPDYEKNCRLVSADGFYYEMEGYMAWSARLGWMRRCECGCLSDQGRKRKCERCQKQFPTQAQFHASARKVTWVFPDQGYIPI